MTVISESQLSPELTSQTHKDVYVEANSSGISQEIKKKVCKGRAHALFNAGEGGRG